MSHRNILNLDKVRLGIFELEFNGTRSFIRADNVSKTIAASG